MKPESQVPAIAAMIQSSLASQRAATCNDDDDGDGTTGSPSSARPMRTPQKTHKARSLSDSAPHPHPQLSPSPKFREPLHASQDDRAADPRTPRRPDVLARGLSLQMPARELPMPSPAHFAARVPLSPQLDSRNTYASPASLLPRRSRGAEFSRACTNLHHSTLADQSSPDSSPTITQKGMTIPSRMPRPNSMMLDSPNMPHCTWGSTDRTAASSSVGSISMIDSISSSSDDDGDPMDPDDTDDPVLMTPQAMRSAHVPFGGPAPGHAAGAWANVFSPGAVPTFMSIQRARLRKGRSRKSSSSASASASGHSSMASPVPPSPPNGRTEGYFAREAAREAVIRNSGSRRESLSLFAKDLNISSGNDSGDEAARTHQVVRRAVSRRGNLLPKSRQFGRIKAELYEEAAPVDSEFRREAEIIRQVREADVDERPSGTAQSSPSLLPTVPGLDGPLEGVPEEESVSYMSLDSSSNRGLFPAFNMAAGNSYGRGSWGRELAQTPPPTFPRAGSSAVSEDMSMDSPSVSSTSTPLPSLNITAGPSTNHYAGWISRASTPQPLAPPSAADGLKKSNKRRRDDDLDVNSIKRRAVSPGVSVHNSPVLSQSPAQRDGGLWGTAAKGGRDHGVITGVHAAGEKSSSGGSSHSMTPSLGPKRIGLQGITDTNDGLMKMSIE